MDNPTEPRFLIIGRILRPHGLRGEMHASILTELPERFEWLDRVYLSRTTDGREHRAVAVESVRYHRKNVLLKLAGYDSRNDVETLRSQWLLVPEAEGIPLEEGEFYQYRLENLAVYSDEGGYLGRIVEILETKANDVFVVRGDNGDLLLPDIEQVILDIDPEAGRMTVHLLPGLVP